MTSVTNGNGSLSSKGRKSRRTHKNSRDGCTNCKSKRIKCSEELPQCFNCVKKNYRCCYLDFPEEKLEHIRMKNEKKRKEMLQRINYPSNGSTYPKKPDEAAPASNSAVAGAIAVNSVPASAKGSISHPRGPNPFNQLHIPTISPSPTLNQSHNGQLFNYPNNLVQQQQQQPVRLINGVGNQPYIQAAPPPQQAPAYLGYYDNELKDYFESKDNLRFAVYHDVFQQVTHQNLGDQTIAYNTESAQDNFYNKSNNYNYDTNSKLNPDNGKIDLSKINIPDSNLDLDYSQFASNQFVNFENNSVNYLTTMNSNVPAYTAARSSKLNPLPNAINDPQSFKLMSPIHKHGKVRNRKLVTSQMQYFYAPCWNRDIQNRVWINVFSLSDVITVYCTYFLDRSLSILLSNLSNILNNDYIKHIHNTYQMLESTHQNQEDFFINENVLRKLTAKSYVYYDNVIKELRASLMDYHAEYTVKLSFFSSYSTFLHLHASVDTFITTYCGTASLLVKSCAESRTINELTPSLKVIIDLFTNHSLASKVPDLSFSTIPLLFKIFVDFKNFLITHTTVYQEQESNSIRDFIIKHDCIEFDKFFRYLMEEFDPKVRTINEKYKKNHGIYDTNPNHLYFVSFSSFFELLNKWFNIYPSAAINMGSKISPFKKVFYLFFNVMGKLLTQIYTPIRSIFMTDCCNLFCTNVEFDFGLYKLDQEHLNAYQYNYLSTLSQHMLKMIHYLNSRTIFYSHKLSNDTVLNEDYLEHAGEDVLHIKPKKMNVNEEPLLISEDNLVFAIKYENYPMFGDFEYEGYQSLINQNKSPKAGNFNYKVGIHDNDFNCEPMLKKFIHQQKVKWELNQPNIREVRTRMQNFESSRRFLLQSIAQSLPSSSR